MYSLLLEIYIKDSKEKDHFWHAIEIVPCVAKKAEWTLCWINSFGSFAERIRDMKVVEALTKEGAANGILYLRREG